MRSKLCFLLTPFLLLILFTPVSLNAQSSDHSEQLLERYDLSYRLFRASLFPPISTNGARSGSYAARFSLNILAGYNGALHDRGFELGGLLNINRYYAHGVQLAGVGNYSGRNTAGIQFSGGFNYAGRDLRGIQLTGGVNIAGSDMQGIQLSGGVNWAGADAQGIHIAGLVNSAHEGMQGMFLSGLANVSDDMQGLIFSGGINYARGDIQGLVGAGILSYAERFQGLGASSINITEEFQGIQAGLLNISKYGQGIQAGLINYGHEIDGVPVGLISYYRTGRRNIDVWTSDGGFSNFGFKLGTEDTYNMISIGFNPLIDRDVWQLGWSIGSKRIYKNFYTYSDFSYFKINEGGWTKDLNSLLKYRVLFGKKVGNGLEIYGGPTLNMMITRVEQSRDYTWYRLFDFGGSRRYIVWLGYSVGIELF